MFLVLVILPVSLGLLIFFSKNVDWSGNGRFWIEKWAKKHLGTAQPCLPHPLPFSLLVTPARDKGYNTIIPGTVKISGAQWNLFSHWSGITKGQLEKMDFGIDLRQGKDAFLITTQPRTRQGVQDLVQIYRKLCRYLELVQDFENRAPQLKTSPGEALSHSLVYRDPDLAFATLGFQPGDWDYHQVLQAPGFSGVSRAKWLLKKCSGVDVWDLVQTCAPVLGGLDQASWEIFLGTLEKDPGSNSRDFLWSNLFRLSGNRLRQLYEILENLPGDPPAKGLFGFCDTMEEDHREIAEKLLKYLEPREALSFCRKNQHYPIFHQKIPALEERLGKDDGALEMVGGEMGSICFSEVRGKGSDPTGEKK